MLRQPTFRDFWPKRFMEEFGDAMNREGQSGLTVRDNKKDFPQNEDCGFHLMCRLDMDVDDKRIYGKLVGDSLSPVVESNTDRSEVDEPEKAGTVPSTLDIQRESSTRNPENNDQSSDMLDSTTVNEFDTLNLDDDGISEEYNFLIDVSSPSPLTTDDNMANYASSRSVTERILFRYPDLGHNNAAIIASVLANGEEAFRLFCLQVPNQRDTPQNRALLSLWGQRAQKTQTCHRCGTLRSTSSCKCPNLCSLCGQQKSGHICPYGRWYGRDVCTQTPEGGFVNAPKESEVVLMTKRVREGMMTPFVSSKTTKTRRR